jgi:beta-mannosidase
VHKLERGWRPAWACGQVIDLLGNWQAAPSAPGGFVSPMAEGFAPAWAELAQLGPAFLPADGPRLDSQDWWFRLIFDAGLSASQAAAHWDLCLDGLATVAEAWLNGQALTLEANMHLAQRVPVQDSLRAGRNELVIACRALDQVLGQRRPRPRWRAPMIEHQQLRWVRTTLLGRTPGWSPPTPVVGPWRWLGLVQPLATAPQDLRWCSAFAAGQARLTLSCLLPDGGAQGAVLEAWVTVQGQGQHWRLPLASMAQPQGRDQQGQQGHARSWALDAALPEARAWWPHTHGEPTLYQVNLHVRRASPSDTHEFGLGQTGFRTVQVDAQDGGFSVFVNGEAVFCRGACWTPIDVRTLDAPDAQAYAPAIQQFRAAGLNMLRVGGTMAYEADAFYDACDRAGVLVWQDLMFANMDYPEDAAFTEGVLAEVAQQAQRWQGRPCMAVVCGNSEVSQQAAMFGALRERWSPALFEQTLPQALASWCPGLPYWPSSAFGGAFPHQNDSGTTSYYGVGAYQRELSDARRSGLKFATECLAFANIPEPDGLADMPGGLGLRTHHPGWKARTPRDLGAGWDFEDVRDHYVERLYGVDPARLRYSDHDRYLALGRAAVAEVVYATFAEWRAGASACQGALIWFWRDLWAGAGWGVLDSAGRPKSPYYALQRACQPTGVHMTDEGGNGYALHLINEREQALMGTLNLTAWKDGEAQVAQVKLPVTVAARQTLLMPWAQCFDWFADWSWFYRFGPLGANVLMAVWRDEQGQELGRTHALPGGLNLPQERDLGLSAQAVRREDGGVTVRLHTRRFAQSVHWDVPGWVASDAYFHLAPGQTAEVHFKPHGAAAAKPFGGAVLALNGSMSVAILMADA